MGGLAFHARVPEWTAQISRARRDIDLTTTSRDRKAVSELLAREGYVGDRQYNALYGHKQLYFVDPARGRPVDVLVDKLEMCHRFDFGDRLAVSQQTLPLAELLLSKLQVVKMNRKDALDALILLAEHRLAPGDHVDGVDTISVNRIVALTSADWGWWRTLTMNLGKLADIWRSDVQPDELAVGRPHLFDVATQIDAMRTAIDEAPKSTKWKFRSRVGDRVAWYQEPEEVGHGPG